jgi:hypothetical protein
MYAWYHLLEKCFDGQTEGLNVHSECANPGTIMRSTHFRVPGLALSVQRNLLASVTEKSEARENF